VIGGGHAGCEAALAAARMGCTTLVLTANIDTIGLMSCNPSIGGVGKGHLVKEIDALGGEMGKAADTAAIQFRRLNTRKGAAVQATRIQADRQSYRAYMKKALESEANIEIKQAMVEEFLVDGKKVAGVKTALGERFFSDTVVVTPGTFPGGLIHIGLTLFSSGRAGQAAAGTRERGGSPRKAAALSEEQVEVVGSGWAGATRGAIERRLEVGTGRG